MTATLVVLAFTTTYVVKAGAPSALPHDDIHGRRLNVGLTQTDKLFSDEGNELDRYGSAVAVQGNLAVVGAPYEDENGFVDSGAVHIWSLGEQMGSSDKVARLTGQ